jgi:predicted  nucleic acid-binding Zn-ribbon protein
MKDWDFYTTEIGTALQELRDAKEKYENQSKALFETELRLEAEKEDLARIRKDIETMRSQLTGSIHTITSSKASTTSPTTPQKPQ